MQKGQVLATLRSGVERAALDLAKAKVAFAARKVQRNKELYRKQMISIHQKDELETELKLLELEMKEAKERLKEEAGSGLQRIPRRGPRAGRGPRDGAEIRAWDRDGTPPSTRREACWNRP